MIDTTLITNLGFPIFISLYFIFRMEKVLKENTRALQTISLQIAEIKK